MTPPIQPSGILDYASPRRRGRTRLPSQSRLDVTHDRDGVTVTETLRGKTAAYLAMAFGLFCICVPPAVVVGESKDPSTLLPRLLRAQFDSDGVVDSCYAIVLSTTEAVVLVLVARNTWRKTVLRARDGTLSLTFSGLFGTREHSWPLGQIVELGVDRTLEAGFSDPRLELVLRAYGGEHAHLFADHGEAELESIAAALREATALANQDTGRTGG